MPVFTLAIAIAVGIVLLLRKARYNYERLPKVPYVAGAQLPDVAVIVPTDASGELLAAFPEDAIVSAETPAAGAAATEAEWLLFPHPSARFARVFLPSLLRYAEEEELQMVNVLLRHETVTLTEKILVPFIDALYFTGVSASAVNSRPPTQFLANHACLLIKRSAYQAIGTHDDLAKRAAGKGIRSRVTRAEHMGSIRSFDGFSPIVRMGKENPLGALQSVLTAILLAAWLPAVVLLGLAGNTRQALLFAALPIVTLFPWYRSVYALLAPMAIYLAPFAPKSSAPK